MVLTFDFDVLVHKVGFVLWSYCAVGLNSICFLIYVFCVTVWAVNADCKGNYCSAGLWRVYHWLHLHAHLTLKCCWTLHNILALNFISVYFVCCNSNTLLDKNKCGSGYNCQWLLEGSNVFLCFFMLGSFYSRSLIISTHFAVMCPWAL
jgi:hypothetical protein